MLFSRALKQRKAWKFVLQDYNDIFSLVTLPNLFLTWYITHYPGTSDEFDVTPLLKQQFLQTLRDLQIQFSFVVGAWGPSLTVPAPPPPPLSRLTKTFLSTYDLVLSSEGIYSPLSLPQFTDVLVTCTRDHALVASKKVYFGVGGGMTEFAHELEKHNRRGEIVWQGGDVTRVIIQV
jgi:protein-histidine N-methyltransferase